MDYEHACHLGMAAKLMVIPCMHQSIWQRWQTLLGGMAVMQCMLPVRSSLTEHNMLPITFDAFPLSASHNGSESQDSMIMMESCRRDHWQ